MEPGPEGARRKNPRGRGRVREKQGLDRGPGEGTPLKIQKQVTVSTTIGQVGVNLPLNCNTSQEKRK